MLISIRLLGGVAVFAKMFSKQFADVGFVIKSGSRKKVVLASSAFCSASPFLRKILLQKMDGILRGEEKNFAVFDILNESDERARKKSTKEDGGGASPSRHSTSTRKRSTTVSVPSKAKESKPLHSSANSTNKSSSKEFRKSTMLSSHRSDRPSNANSKEDGKAIELSDCAKSEHEKSNGFGKKKHKKSKRKTVLKEAQAEFNSFSERNSIDYQNSTPEQIQELWKHNFDNKEVNSTEILKLRNSILFYFYSLFFIFKFLYNFFLFLSY